jgi:Cft2 family RNA processing exonuclease
MDYRDLRRDAAPAVDLILVSHAHQDHISDLEFVDSGFPILGSRITAFISKVLQDVGP